MDKKNSGQTEKALKDAARKLLLSCEDWTDVTARAITSEAGVNLAMINYCFGSKEALFFEELLELINSSLTPKEKLIEGYFQMMKLMLEYFGMAQAVIKFIVMNKSLDMDAGTTELVKEHFGGRKTEGECMIIAYELESIHELLALRHKEIQDICGIDLKDDTVLRRIITDNVDRFLKD